MSAFTVILLFSVMLGFTSFVNATLLEQAVALCDIKQNNAPTSWTSGNGETICNWTKPCQKSLSAITCDSNGNVLMIYLQSQKMTGTIAPSFGTFTALTYLYMFANSLTGSIPASFGNLTSIIRILLYNNKLNGTLPTTLRFLTNLQLLTLNTNKITGQIPDVITELPKLTTLNFFTNQFTGTIPNNIGKMYLTSLNLYDNKLSGTIPPSIGNLTNITYLNLSTNSLIGTIPTSFAQLTALAQIYIENNYLVGTIPQQVKNVFENLTYCYLDRNCLQNETICGASTLRSTEFCDCLWEGNCYVNSVCYASNEYGLPCQFCNASQTQLSLQVQRGDGYCLIGDNCVAFSQTNSQNACQACFHTNIL